MMRDGFVSAAEHGRIHYLEAGRGPVLALLHSNGNSAYEYEEVSRLLAERFRVLALDFPGHGDSEPLRRHYRVEDYADAVIAVMDALSIDKASVLGSSVGGTVCVDLGVRHAQRILRNYIVEAPIRTEAQWRERWLATERSYAQVTQTEEQVRPRIRKFTNELFERWNIDRNKAGAWAMIDVMWALREYDVQAALPRIATATAAIYGSKSPHPRALDVFAQKLPSARRVVLEGCGHFPMLDDPAGLAAAILSFDER